MIFVPTDIVLAYMCLCTCLLYINIPSNDKKNNVTGKTPTLAQRKKLTEMNGCDMIELFRSVPSCCIQCFADTQYTICITHNTQYKTKSEGPKVTWMNRMHAYADLQLHYHVWLSNNSAICLLTRVDYWGKIQELDEALIITPILCNMH